MEGWIKLHRQLQENPLWTCEPFTRGQAWVDLILLANHKYGFFYKRGVKIEVKRGQVGVSEIGLADRWKWSRSKVRKFIKDLEKEQQVIQQKTNVTQILTLVKYEEYQQKEQQVIQQKDTKRTPKEHQKDTNKNEKKKENKKKNIYSDFYDKQIEIAKDEKYEIFVRYLFGSNITGLVYENVLSLSKQISYYSFQELMKNYSKEAIKSKIEEMEGKDISKFKSFPLTLNNWLKMKPK